MWKRRYLSEALYPMQSPVVALPRPRLSKRQLPKRTATGQPRPITPPVNLTLFDVTPLVTPIDYLDRPDSPVYR